MTSFERALAFVLRWEGGYVNHPLDPGGATNKGITQRTYDKYRDRLRLPHQSVLDILPVEVEEIYFENYWKAGKCDQLPPPVDLVHFDSCINHGLGNAAKRLQFVAGVAQDGAIGPLTLAAVAKAIPRILALEYIEERVRFYHAIVKSNPSQVVFLQGWLNRMASLQLEIR